LKVVCFLTELRVLASETLRKRDGASIAKNQQIFMRVSEARRKEKSFFTIRHAGCSRQSGSQWLSKRK
jgi:hypothetical protein